MSNMKSNSMMLLKIGQRGSVKRFLFTQNKIIQVGLSLISDKL